MEQTPSSPHLRVPLVPFPTESSSPSKRNQGAHVFMLLAWDKKRATSKNKAYLTALLACWQDTAAYGPGLQTNVSTV